MILIRMTYYSMLYVILLSWLPHNPKNHSKNPNFSANNALSIPEAFKYSSLFGVGCACVVGELLR